MLTEAEIALRIAIAAASGAAVGVERQWSETPTTPTRFAGLRTFTMLGTLGGIAGIMWASDAIVLAALLLGVAATLAIVSYAAVSPKNVDGTTAVAAFVVLAAGALSGYGQWHVGSGIAAVTALLLAEKSALHHWVESMDAPELRAAFRFAVMALVILPILPEGPYGPLGGVRPRQLWMLVLFFSGLSFVGYVARAAAGPRGYVWAGLLGGLVSSTNVAFTFSRTSRKEAGAHAALAFGVIAACTVLYFRVLTACAVLYFPLVSVVWKYLIPPAVVGIAMLALAIRGNTLQSRQSCESPNNPLQFLAAIEMGVLFQIVLWAMSAIKDWGGQLGLLASAAVLGLTDMDALTIAMTREAQNGDMLPIAAKAIGLGIVANSALKLASVLVLGAGSFRMWAACGLLVLGTATAFTLLF